MNKNIYEITKKNNCTGCRACEQLCPVHCIDFKEDKEGFLFPIINKINCIECGLCKKRCPANIMQKRRTTSQKKVFAAKLKDKNLLKLSASGGAFVLFAKFVLKRKGKIFGCIWDSDMTAIHASTSTIDGVLKMQGSKYVQSSILHTFSETKRYLNNGEWVLFTGTPCQIAGLNTYLNKNYEKLITVDLICHGVTSPRFFHKYLNWLSEKYGEEIISYDFRSKEKSGWGSGYKALAKTKTKTRYLLATLDPYYYAFLYAQDYRECCYKCKYASTERGGDFTIGDFWGVDKFHKELIYGMSEGITAMIVNTPKAEKILSYVKDEIELTPTSIENICAENENLKHPAVRPENRSYFYDMVYRDGFYIYAKKFYRSRDYLILLFKSCIPNKLKKSLKNFLKKL